MNFDSKQFMFDKGAGVFLAEVSELTAGGAKPLMNRASRTLTVRSHKTGAIATFILSNIQTDDDNDVVHWEFKPVGETAEGITVRVLND